MINPEEMTNAEIESKLRDQLRLYTSLWYATQTDQYLNLTFTTILMQLLPTLQFIEELRAEDLGMTERQFREFIDRAKGDTEGR